MIFLSHADGRRGKMPPMDPQLPPLIRALLDPRHYPHPVAEVTLLETHISWVLLAGEFAYKIKKPVQLAFLDFSTLALRKSCCEAELRLNRRFAPELYLEVLGIGNTPQEPVWGGSGPAIEYAVRMRRFDPTQQLDQLCLRGALRAEHLSNLAETLNRFHAQAARADAASGLGAPGVILTEARDNFAELERLLPDATAQQQLSALRQWTEHAFGRLEPLMQARQAAGWVRECHGDLHLANLVLLGERVQMFDCIEFSDELRWIDVASELAFTYMDLVSKLQPGLASWFVNEVLTGNGDFEATLLLRFYAVYRALVRAKVAAIRQTQPGAQHTDAAEHLALAQRLSQPPPRQLVITHGLSGCGKSVAARQLVLNDHMASMLRLRSDVERKRLFGLQPTERSGAQAGIYGSDAHARTYARLYELAGMLLQAGWSVIVDATFLQRADRQAFRALADQMQAGFSILAPQATPEELQRRIIARSAEGQDASDATLQVLARQMAVIEPLDVQERRWRMASAAPVPDFTPPGKAV